MSAHIRTKSGMGCYPSQDTIEVVVDKEKAPDNTQLLAPLNLHLHVIYIREDKQHHLAVSSTQFDSKGAFKILGVDEGTDYKLIGTFTLDGEVRAVRYSPAKAIEHTGKFRLNGIQGRWQEADQQGDFHMDFKGESWHGKTASLVLQQGSQLAGIVRTDYGWGVVVGEETKGALKMDIWYADGTMGKLVGTKEFPHLFLNLTSPGQPETAAFLELVSDPAKLN